MKYIIALTLSDMSAGMYFFLKYFSFTYTNISLRAKFTYNDTIYSVPSLTL